MKYFNIRYLLIFLVINGITAFLIDYWTSDKGWLPIILIVYGIISILFWLSISFISYKRKAVLKQGLLYYLGLGIWNILLTIEYFKLQLLGHNLSDILSWIPYAIIIVMSLLPIKQIWNSKKESTTRQQYV